MCVSRSSTRRAQTEPLAALAAIAAVGVALVIYAGAFADVLPADSDRSVEDATLERVWQEVETGGTIETGSAELGDELRYVIDGIDPAVVPDGYAVRVTIAGVDENGDRAADSRIIDRAGIHSSSAAVPARARSAKRPIAVQRSPGDVRAGRLRVEVWS